MLFRSSIVVSGKKLISVLQSGGDGYSDPRGSVMSGSSYYRDSMFPNTLPPQRLQLGSPMRPESGVVIMRSGPGRTPIQEQNAFSFDSPHPHTPSFISYISSVNLVLPEPVPDPRDLSCDIRLLPTGSTVIDDGVCGCGESNENAFCS